MTHSFSHLSTLRGKRAPKVFAGTMVYLLCFAMVFSGFILPAPGRAQVTEDRILSLKEVPVPVPTAAIITVVDPLVNPIPGPGTNLNFQPLTVQFVKNQAALIQLGKALFWDMQVGSDGIQACASCHFSAGEDTRSKNQISPGLADTNFGGDGTYTGEHATSGDTTFGNSTVPFTAYDQNNPAGPLNPPNPLFNVPGKPGFGPNYDLVQADFALNGWFNPTALVPRNQPGLTGGSSNVTVFQELALVDSDTNDVIGSQGVRKSNFVAVTPGSAVDQGTPVVDNVFNVHAPPDLPGNVRQVTGRNAPTTINAVFNFDNFWDGRASFIFNGVNPFGFRDRKSTLKRFVTVNGVPAVKDVFVRITSSSLASQAVGPPLSDVEMSWALRSFPDLGKKMLSLRPLGKQLVHPQDSVLGPLSRATIDSRTGAVVGANGLNKATYVAMIKAAFKPQWWNAPDLILVNKATAVVQKASTNDPRTMVVSPGEATVVKADQLKSMALNPMEVSYTQMEYNFSLFWGLAVQAYEATLISDDTPFDRYMGAPTLGIAPKPNALNARQKLGLNIFMEAGQCDNCHRTPITTSHSVFQVQPDAQGVPLPGIEDGIIETMAMADGETANYDHGMYNIGVRRTTEDLGRAGTAPNAAPFLNPLDGGKPFPLSYVELVALKNRDALPPDVARFVPSQAMLDRRVTRGNFKVPNLRNELYRGPYFHNGDSATLRHVVEFYARGGNFPNTNIRELTVDIEGIPELRFPEFIPNAKRNVEALVNFLAHSLTDQRVALEKAPFDHPQLFVPHGANAVNPNLDLMMELPPVGSGGRAKAIPTFLNLNPQDSGP